ncbi:MAG: WYL domain-containing protein [Ketobacter sp.]|nr:WYL domain-containing protein [Ketobacter sp.]
MSANLIDTSSPILCLHPTTTAWLHASRSAQIDRLLLAANDSTMWQAAVDKLRLSCSATDAMTIDYRIYIQQQLRRQQNQSPPTTETAVWRSPPNPDTWALTIPDTLPLWLHVDLRQLGTWQPDEPLCCTGTTIGKAIKRGYGIQVIQWLFETATQQPFSAVQTTQLIKWEQQVTAVRLRPVYLLSTNHPQKMATILRQKRLRKHVVEQLSPRHAIVNPDIARPLSRKITNGENLLPQPHNQNGSIDSNETAAQQWLALRIMIGLGELIPLPYPAPHGLLDALTHTLSPHEHTTLEQHAQKIIQSLRDAIRGQDAFFPSSRPLNHDHLTQLEDAINKEGQITIQYQALGIRTPRCHTIEPLWLHKRGELYYLFAYSHLAENNLTFRLDRIVEICEDNGITPQQ